jgi:agmatinase
VPNVRPTLLGVPFDAASSFQRGAAAAPPAIRAALRCDSSNSWTEDGLDITAPGILADGGDLDVASAPAAEARAIIEAGVAALLDRGDTPLVLGGDHSISYPVLRAVARRHPGLTVVHIDAHGDLWDQFEGDRYSHACPFARVMEDKLAERLIQVGIRTINAHQRDQMARYGVETHEMRHWEGPFAIRSTGPIYVSLDIDGLDPAYVAGISHPEPGGLSVRDVVTMLQRLEGPIVGADLVEFNPSNDTSPRTGMVCAKLVKEIVGAIHRNG